MVPTTLIAVQAAFGKHLTEGAPMNPQKSGHLPMAFRAKLTDADQIVA
jgi:hypothetical protein